MSIINKLPIEGSGEYFKIKIDFNIDLCVELIANKTAWKGTWISKQIEEFCQALKLNMEDYKIELKNVLATNLGLENYFYSIAKDTLIIKKIVTNSKMKMKFAIIELQEINYQETAESFIELAIDLNKNIQSELEDKREENIALVNDKSVLLDKLSKYKCLKEEIERTLYGKFLVLLNSKKDKIRLLEELLEARNKTDSQQSVISSKSRRGNRRQIDSDSESEDLDSDFAHIHSQDDSEVNIVLPKRNKSDFAQTSSTLDDLKKVSVAAINAQRHKAEAERVRKMEMDLSTEELFMDF